VDLRSTGDPGLDELDDPAVVLGACIWVPICVATFASSRRLDDAGLPDAVGEKASCSRHALIPLLGGEGGERVGVLASGDDGVEKLSVS
jgi:hypothetical protein